MNDLSNVSQSRSYAAKVEIFNLNDNSRSSLEAKGTRVILEAGYLHTKATLFRGNITKVVHRSSPPDIITTLEVRDGDNRFRNTTIDKGYPAGVKTRLVIEDIAKQMDLPIGIIVGVPDNQYANGLSLSGPARLHLDYLTKNNDLEWSIQDETLQIIPKQQFTIDDVVFLTPRS